MSENLELSHIIYHVPGRKVGCTKDLAHRIKEAGYKRVEVISRLFGYTDEEAGDEEWREADARGYPRGTHYAEAIRRRRNGVAVSITSPNHVSRRPEIARAVAKRCLEAGRHITQQGNPKSFRNDPELNARAVKASLSSPKHVSKDSKKMAALARKSVAAQLAKGTHLSQRDMSAMQRKKMALGTQVTQQRRKCPHCEFVGSPLHLGRYHGDRCKQRVVS